MKLKLKLAAVLSAIVLVMTPMSAMAAAPAAPSIPAVSSSSETGAAANEAKVLVTWTGSAGPDLAGHTVRLTPDGGSAITGVAACAGSACSATFSSLTGGTSYTATVTATNGANESTSVSSNPFIARSIASAPQARAVSTSGTDIVLTWTAPASNGGSTITGYSISAPGSDFTTVASVGADIRTYTAAGLTRGTSYTFQIVAVNGIGNSVSGDFPAQVAPTSPDAPTAPSISASGTVVTVDWVAPASGGAQIQSYVVTLYRGSSVVDTASAVDGSLATHEFATSTAGDYKATVAARNSVDLGPASAFSAVASVTGGAALLANVPVVTPSAISPFTVGQTQALTATAPSLEPVTLVSLSTAICSLNAGVLKALSVGTCSVSATAAATDTHDSGSRVMSIAVTAAAAAGGGGGAAAVVAPVLTARPVLTGSAVVGDYLVASAGTWQSQANLDFSYRWLSCDIALSAPTASQVEKNCQAIGTERLFRYLVSATDDGKNLLVEVTALNSAKLTTVTFSSSVLFNAVPEAPATPAYWPKKLNDSSVKMYAKNIVGAGKVQFFLNGKEVAWVRAADANDPKLRTANGFQYLVRTVTLKAGMKNVLEIYVDGERVRRAAYSY